MNLMAAPLRPATILLQLGFAAAVAQAVLLREAMAALGGSELAWGVVLSLWLVGMGIGARIGVGTGSTGLARWLPVAVLAVTAVGVVLFRAAPALVGATVGESMTTWHTIWVWSTAVLPAAFLGGLAFPALAAEPAAGGAAGAYAWEAIGALAGGVLFTFVLAPLGTAATMCLGLGALVVMTCWRRSRMLAVAVAAVAITVTLISGDWLARAGWQWAGRTNGLKAWAETRHQRLELGGDEQVALYADGRLVASYPDPYLTAPRAHLLMLLHPSPGRVLMSGGLADGSIEHVLHHPIERLQLVEDDPALVRLLPSWYGLSMQAAIADERVRVGHGDLSRALDSGEAWDLVLLLGSYPSTLRHNRRFSLELLQTCGRRLAPDGVLVLEVGVGDTYLGGAAGRLLAVTVSTMRRVFPRVVAIPGESILLVAGCEAAVAAVLDSSKLARRWNERHIDDPLFLPEMIPLLVDRRRAEELSTSLDASQQECAAPLNTMDRPRAVLLGAGLAEARGQPPLLRVAQGLEARAPTPLLVVLAVVVLILLVIAVVYRLSRTDASAATLAAGVGAVVGCTSMAWWLLLVAAWQATLGSVYAEVGALSSTFMAGLAGAAWWARRRRHPESMLPVLLVAGIVLSVAIACGLPSLLPRLVIPVLLLVGGALTGAAFSGVARLAARGVIRRGAGIGFAADEAGAALAALLVGLLALPWAGSRAIAVALAVLALAALPAVLVGRASPPPPT